MYKLMTGKESSHVASLDNQVSSSHPRAWRHVGWLQGATTVLSTAATVLAKYHKVA